MEVDSSHGELHLLTGGELSCPELATSTTGWATCCSCSGSSEIDVIIAEITSGIMFVIPAMPVPAGGYEPGPSNAAYDRSFPRYNVCELNECYESNIRQPDIICRPLLTVDLNDVKPVPAIRFVSDQHVERGDDEQRSLAGVPQGGRAGRLDAGGKGGVLCHGNGLSVVERVPEELAAAHERLEGDCQEVVVVIQG